MSRRKRRVFTQEQKEAAVEHLRQTGKTVYQAAQDLDLTETALRRWLQESEREHSPLVLKVDAPGGSVLEACLL